MGKVKVGFVDRAMPAYFGEPPFPRSISFIRVDPCQSVVKNYFLLHRSG
jgi:hypothetical protein